MIRIALKTYRAGVAHQYKKREEEEEEEEEDNNRGWSDPSPKRKAEGGQTPPQAPLREYVEVNRKGEVLKGLAWARPRG